MPFLQWEDEISPRVEWLAHSADTMLQELVQQGTAALMPFLRAAAPVGQGFDRTGAPRPGGTLRNSLFWEEGMLGAVLLGAEHGRFVITGTAPHLIRPRQARALAFWWPKRGGLALFAQVHHPGTAPNDFRQRAVQDAFDTETLPNVIRRVVSTWLAGEAT